MNRFYIDIILLSIKSFFLSIKLDNNPPNTLIEIFMSLMSLIYYFFKDMENLIFFLRKGNIYTPFSNFIISFKNYYNKKVQKYKKEIINIINKNNLDFLKDIHVIQINAAHRFQYIVETIFSKECILKFEFFKMEKSILEQFEIEKKYRKIKKNLFSWNNSYSDLNLFYSQKGKKLLKYKILHHYTQEMTLPLLTPILNINSYLPSGFNKFFREKYNKETFDLIDKSFIDEDFKIIKR